MASIESVASDLADIIGCDVSDIKITFKGTQMLITIDDQDEDDYDDADEDFDGDDE